MSFTYLRKVVTAAVVVVCVASTPTRAQEATPSALEKDPSGWVVLFAEAGPDFKGWSRGPIPPKGELGPVTPSQWSLDVATGVVRCKGNGGHEWIRWDKEVGDAIFHVEWRFTPVVTGKKSYNSGVYVRNSADATVWHQAQTAGGNGSYLFGESPKGGKLTPFSVGKKPGPSREKPAGEWNTFEITCKGPELSLWVNGAVVGVFKECGQPRGHVGLEAEGYEIEFRNVKLKTLDH
jgi:Domain of Unknown Function (DUF1080)